VHKILTCRHCKNVNLQLELHQDNITRGHSLKLVNSRCRHDLRKFSFSLRIVNIWNSLPASVISANNINTFKNKYTRQVLDKPRTYVRLQKFINRNGQQKFSWQFWWHHFLVSLLCHAHLIGTEASAYAVFSALLCLICFAVLISWTHFRLHPPNLRHGSSKDNPLFDLFSIHKSKRCFFFRRSNITKSMKTVNP